MISQNHETALETRIQNALASDGLIVSTLQAAWPQTLAIYAFGSRVQGLAQPNSDLDLALLVAGYANPLQCWDVSQQLATALGCEVDLLDLRAASTVMQYQVVTTGQTLWAQQPEADLFACFVMNEKLEALYAFRGLELKG